MPTSNSDQISLVLEIITRLNPRRTLEIGTGAGKYGVLCREYLGPGAVIHGIEGFSGYVGDVHRATYNEMFVGDALDILPRREPNYDLVFMIDVFEHFAKSDGAAVLRECARLAPTTLLAVPATWYPQGAYAGNEFEVHRAHYTRRDLHQLGFAQVWRIGGQHVALRSQQRLELRSTLRRWALTTVAPSFLVDFATSLRDWRRRAVAP